MIVLKVYVVRSLGIPFEGHSVVSSDPYSVRSFSIVFQLVIVKAGKDHL